MAAMVDSCVLLDVLTNDPRWSEWSLKAMSEHETLVIDPVIYSEVSVGFGQIEEFESVLTPEDFEYRAIPREAAFLAGKCFLKYQRAGGRKTVPLPDFLIGAHAAVERLPLVTRDVRRFRTYFPRLALICPEA